MTAQVKHLIEIAELHLKKSAVILDLLKNNPNNVGIAMATNAEVRFDIAIKQKEWVYQNRRARPLGEKDRAP